MQSVINIEIDFFSVLSLLTASKIVNERQKAMLQNAAEYNNCDVFPFPAV